MPSFFSLLPWRVLWFLPAEEVKALTPAHIFMLWRPLSLGLKAASLRAEHRRVSWWRNAHPASAFSACQVARTATAGALSVKAFKPQNGWPCISGISKLWGSGQTQCGPWAHPDLCEQLCKHLEQRPLRCRALFPPGLSLAWDAKGSKLQGEKRSREIPGHPCQACAQLAKRLGKAWRKKNAAQVYLYQTKLGLHRAPQPNPRIKSGWTNIPNIQKSINKKLGLCLKVFPPREWVYLRVLHKLSKRKSESFRFLEETYRDSWTCTVSYCVHACARVHACMCVYVYGSLTPGPNPVGQHCRRKSDPPCGHSLLLLPTKFHQANLQDFFFYDCFLDKQSLHSVWIF